MIVAQVPLEEVVPPAEALALSCVALTYAFPFARLGSTLLHVEAALTTQVAAGVRSRS